MPALILQRFIDRIRSDIRPAYPSIYIELGRLIANRCDATPEERLSKAAREKIALLLKAEISSNFSGLQTFQQFSALFKNVYERNLLPDVDFDKLTLNFLNATASCLPLERSRFVENVNECLAEPLGTLRQNELANLLYNVCRDPELNDLSDEARRAAIPFLEPALCIDLPKPPSELSDERSLKPAEPDSSSSLRPGLTQSRAELALLTRLIHWRGLSYEDSSKGNKTNCILLVELLEMLVDGVDEIDFLQIDSLNQREDIFAEIQPEPVPFYDGEF